MPTSGRWSYSEPGAGFASATVTMKKNGSPWSTTVTTTGGSFGDPALVWQSSEITAPEVGAVDTYDIAISGLASGPVSYQVKTFRAGVARVGSVTVTGTVRAGTILTAVAHDLTPSTAQPKYVWYIDGVQVSDRTTYTPKLADVGKQLVVKASASLPQDRWASPTTSSDPMTVQPALLTPMGVGISGDPIVGSFLQAAPGQWGPPVSVELQWLRAGQPIQGANDYFYILTEADRGARIALRVTASAAGYETATVTTAEVGPVTGSTPTTPPPTPSPTTPAPTPKPTTPAPPAVFTTVPTPTISGTAQVGKTMAAAPGVWSPAPSSLSYQWYRSGKAIAGATGQTYRLAPATLGGTITVRVTALRAGYVTTTSKASKASAAVKAGTMIAVKPRISGTARVGRALTAAPGRWQPTTTTFSYQWYRNKSKIKGATKVAYVIKSADKGKKIRVKVTGRATGYTAKAMTSSKTGKVKK